MDLGRFNDVAREIAVGASRRQALKLLGSGIAGGFLALSGVKQAEAADCTRAGKKCQKSKECCAGLACMNGRCVTAAGPAFLVCVCHDNTEIDLCVPNDVCNTGPGQDVFCGPACAAHGGEAATGCLANDSRCAV